MNIEEISKRIAELHYPNKPNTIIDEPYRQARMKTLRKQVETELKNCFIPDVSQQRKLLINYNNYLYAEYFGADFDDSDVDGFLDQMCS